MRKSTGIPIVLRKKKKEKNKQILGHHTITLRSRHFTHNRKENFGEIWLFSRYVLPVSENRPQNELLDSLNRTNKENARAPLTHFPGGGRGNGGPGRSLYLNRFLKQDKFHKGKNKAPLFHKPEISARIPSPLETKTIKRIRRKKEVETQVS